MCFLLSKAYLGVSALSCVMSDTLRLFHYKHEPIFSFQFLWYKKATKEPRAGRCRLWWTPPLTYTEYCIEAHVVTRTRID